MFRLAEYGEDALRMKRSGYTYQEIADKFGVSRQAIHSAVMNLRKHKKASVKFKLIRNPNLRKWVEENCKTLDEFADMLQMPNAALSRYLKEETKTLKIPFKIQEITRLPLEDIIVKETAKNETTKNESEVKRKMRITLDEGAIMPTRAHDTDAGLDIYARETQWVLAKESAKFDTGVHIELPHGTVGMLKSKSGLNVKHGITSEGVIDVGYTGSIMVKLYNNSGYDYKVNAGDKISQLVIMPILTPDLELVDSLEATERGSNGFGSSGR